MKKLCIALLPEPISTSLAHLITQGWWVCELKEHMTDFHFLAIIYAILGTTVIEFNPGFYR